MRLFPKTWYLLRTKLVVQKLQRQWFLAERRLDDRRDLWLGLHDGRTLGYPSDRIGHLMPAMRGSGSPLDVEPLEAWREERTRDRAASPAPKEYAHLLYLLARAGVKVLAVEQLDAREPQWTLPGQV